MRRLEIEEIRERQLQMLDWFDRYCKEKKLLYSMCGGTLLGAVRHQGYIPWDDDIDIMMPRKDYDTLLKNEIHDSKYEILSPFATYKPPFPYSYIKLWDKETVLYEKPKTKRIKSRIYIDIYPIDGLPDDAENSKKYFEYMKKRNLAFIALRLSFYNYKYGTLRHKFFWRLTNVFAQIINSSEFLRKSTQIAKRYNFEESNYVGNVTCSGYGIKERMSRHIFDDIIEMKFENRKFKAISGYDEYLKNLYGDYMTLPPKEKQVLSHDYVAYLEE